MNWKHVQYVHICNQDAVFHFADPNWETQLLKKQLEFSICEDAILLMVQKSQTTTWDGGKTPMNNGMNYIATG